VVGLDGGESQPHQVRVAVKIELDGPGLGHAVEAREIQHEVVEAACRLPPEAGHHLHRRDIGSLDEPREVAGPLPLGPLLGGLEQGRPQPPPLEARLDERIKGVARPAADPADPYLRQRQALDSDDGTLAHCHQHLGNGVGVGTGEEVGAGLDEGRPRVGRRTLEGEQGGVVVPGRIPNDGGPCKLGQEQMGRRPSPRDRAPLWPRSAAILPQAGRLGQ